MEERREVMGKIQCPYCEEVELTHCGYYICPRCKIAMTEDELVFAIRANEEADLITKLTGQKVLQPWKEG